MQRSSTMDHLQLTKFRSILEKMASEILLEADATVERMQGEAVGHADVADQASAESEREFLLSLRQRERTMLRKIHEALQRIDDGYYGECEECGEDISLARLQARPVTTLCIRCKQHQEQVEAVPGLAPYHSGAPA